MWLYVSPKSNFGAHFDGSSFLLAIDGRNLLPIKWKEHGRESKIHARVSHHPLFLSFSRSIFYASARLIKRTAFCTPSASVWSLILAFPLQAMYAPIYPLIWCAAKASLWLGACARSWRRMTHSISFLSLSRLTHRREIEYIWAWPSGHASGQLTAK
jgi:hypothetical protein